MTKSPGPIWQASPTLYAPTPSLYVDKWWSPWCILSVTKTMNINNEGWYLVTYYVVVGKRIDFEKGSRRSTQRIESAELSATEQPRSCQPFTG